MTTIDDTIATQVMRVRRWAQTIGFANSGVRGDNQIELHCTDGTRLCLWSNQIHGEGRVLVDIKKALGGGTTEGERTGRLELRFTGRDGYKTGEIRNAKAAIQDLVTRHQKAATK